MKTEQKQIEEMVEIMCDDFGASFFAEKLYAAGYRKQSDIIDEFVERLEKYIESRNDLWDEDRPEFDEEFVKFGIQIVADEMRQEMEK